MWDHNFWYWLLTGFRDLLASLIEQAPQHQPLGLAGLAANVLVYGTAILVFFIGSFFHLEVFALTLGATLLLEAVRAVIAVYRWIIGFLPLP